MEEYLIKGPPIAEHEVNYTLNITFFKVVKVFFKVVKAFMIIQRILKSIEDAIVKRTFVSGNNLIVVGPKVQGHHVLFY
jgi:hypothetical protein